MDAAPAPAFASDDAPARRRAVAALLDDARRRLVAAAWIWWPGYLAAGLTLATALVVAPITGHSLDVAGAGGVAGELSELLVVALLGMLAWRFVQIARARPPEGPTRALGRWLAGLAIRDDRWVHAVHTLAVVTVFSVSFGVLKGAIAILVPFGWDIAFMEADRWLHGGRLPHEWLAPLLASPPVLLATNFVYNLWYFIVLGALVIAGARAGERRHGRRHLAFAVAFIAVWLVGGFFLATLFSSAGPCFVGPAGITGEYDALMATLRATNEIVPLWAVSTQDMLWAGHTGARDGTLGISAMPSMHVATAILLALYLGGFGRAYALAGWLFASAIMLGSVLLAWHYAVDGYAGALVAWVLWRVVLRVLPAREAVSGPRPA